MDDIITCVIGGIAAIGAIIAAAWLVSRFWDDIRDHVAAWLRQNNMQESMLMDVIVRFDQTVSRVRSRIFAKTTKTGQQKVMEKILTDEEIAALQEKEPEIFARLKQYGAAEKNLLYLFQ
ncbi:MAG: hypothetical protein AB7S77_00965 [Desulfatirhabdiaceae bacterium]